MFFVNIHVSHVVFVRRATSRSSSSEDSLSSPKVKSEKGEMREVSAPATSPFDTRENPLREEKKEKKKDKEKEKDRSRGRSRSRSTHKKKRDEKEKKRKDEKQKEKKEKEKKPVEEKKKSRSSSRERRGGHHPAATRSPKNLRVVTTQRSHTPRVGPTHRSRSAPIAGKK